MSNINGLRNFRPNQETFLRYLSPASQLKLSAKTLFTSQMTPHGVFTTFAQCHEISGFLVSLGGKHVIPVKMHMVTISATVRFNTGHFAVAHFSLFAFSFPMGRGLSHSAYQPENDPFASGSSQRQWQTQYDTDSHQAEEQGNQRSYESSRSEALQTLKVDYSSLRNHCHTLGLEPTKGLTKSDVNRAFREKSRVSHPDSPVERLSPELRGLNKEQKEENYKRIVTARDRLLEAVNNGTFSRFAEQDNLAPQRARPQNSEPTHSTSNGAEEAQEKKPMVNPQQSSAPQPAAPKLLLMDASSEPTSNSEVSEQRKNLDNNIKDRVGVKLPSSHRETVETPANAAAAAG